MTTDASDGKHKKWVIAVDLRITGLTEDPQVVTDALGIEPTRTWRVGDLVTPPATARRRKSNGWLLDSGCPEDASLEEHFKALVDQLSEVRQHPVRLSQTAETEIRCGITDYDRSVALIVPPDMVDIASWLGAFIYISYYDVSDHGKT